MAKRAEGFGGSWTQQKLRSLEKYLKAYSTIMTKQKFRFAYIDAFAGTGYPGWGKIIDLDGITKFFVKRLKSIFPGVLDPPLQLLNSKNNPLYVLGFAAANEKGAPTAIKIAKHIVSN